MLTEESAPAVARKAERAVVHLVFSRWMILLLAIAVVLPWLIVVFLSARGHAPSGTAQSWPAATTSAAGWTLADPRPGEWVEGKKGPWGQIESMLVTLDVPDESLFVPPASQPPIRWSFPGYGKEKVLTTLRSAGVPEDEVKKLDSSGKWSSDNNIASVEPGDRLILSLAPEVRSKLYAILVGFPQNTRQIDPIWFWPGLIDWQVQDSGLAPESIALLKRLLYPQGENALLFADLEPVLRSLPDDAERRRFAKAVSRKRTVLARLKIGPDSDVEAMSRYWGIGGRRKDVFSLLSALDRVRKGCSLNIVCLLPDFPRDHLYSFPLIAASDKGVNQDCFWTAFNFFNDPPDNRFGDMGYVREVLDRDYYKILEPSQLGDLVLVTAENGTVLHMASYVADDLVFTKNGRDISQPWVFMHMAGLMQLYTAISPPDKPLQPQFFRKKGL